MALVPDLVPACVLALLTFAVHDVAYLVERPLWLDESWVALSTRAPIELLPRLTISTPIGWSLLLRLVPADDGWLRLLPLLFAAACVVVAWFFGRELRMGRYLSLLAALAVLFVPAMLERSDLKQYTAEAFAALVTMVLVARLENDWNRTNLIVLAVFAPIAALFATSMLLVTVAAVVGLQVETIARRSWQRWREATVAGLAACLGVGVVYLAVIRPSASPLLQEFWAGHYLPVDSGLGGALTYLGDRLELMAPVALGFESFAVAAVPLVAGSIVLIVQRRYALASMVPVTIVLVLAASGAEQYPIGPVRLLTFLFAMCAVVMAVGAASVVELARRSGSSLLTFAVLLVICVVWIDSNSDAVRRHTITVEDVRSQVRYVEEHFRPGDVVAVDLRAAWGFAYYSDGRDLTYPELDTYVINYFPEDRTAEWLIQPRSHSADAITAAMAEAEQHLGPDGRLWLIRTRPEDGQPHWNDAVRDWNRRLIEVGDGELLVARPPG